MNLINLVCHFSLGSFRNILFVAKSHTHTHTHTQVYQYVCNMMSSCTNLSKLIKGPIIFRDVVLFQINDSIRILHPPVMVIVIVMVMMVTMMVVMVHGAW